MDAGAADGSLASAAADLVLDARAVTAADADLPSARSDALAGDHLAEDLAVGTA
jgi:hypothetical protein